MKREQREACCELREDRVDGARRYVWLTLVVAIAAALGGRR